jgi:N-acetylmuramoyl-L-alanine amidase CwlA
MNINKDYLFKQREINMMKLSGMTPIGITVHNTYNSAPAINEAKNQFNNNTKKGSSGVAVHFYVDEDNIYQLLPLDIHGWHAGDGAKGTGNRKTIAIEICRSTDYSDDKYARAEQLTIKLLDKLLKDFNFTTKDIYQHKHWSGKKCPHRLIEGNPINWETFIGLIGKDNVPNDKPLNKDKVGDLLVVRKGSFKGQLTVYKDKALTQVLKTYNVDNEKCDLQFTITENLDPVFKVKQYSMTPMDGKINAGYIKWQSGIGFDKFGTERKCYSQTTTTKPKEIKVGSRVQLKTNATKYATGQNIPARFKGKNYTVQQKRSGESLLKELYSWVYDKDLIVL